MKLYGFVIKSADSSDNLVGIYIGKDKNENVDVIVVNMDFQFMKIFILIFADLLILPFIIYTKCSFRRSKEKRKGSKGSKNEIQLIHNKPTFTKSKGIVVTYTILISFLDLFSRSVYFIFFLLTSFYWYL